MIKEDTLAPCKNLTGYGIINRHDRGGSAACFPLTQLRIFHGKTISVR